jgi:hypothetical protein
VLTTLYSSCKKDLEINTEPQTFISDVTGRINCYSIKTNVIWLENMQSRFALNNNRKDIALQLQQKFIKYGYANAVLDSFYISGTYNNSSYSTWQYNVIASITETDYPDQICIAGATTTVSTTKEMLTLKHPVLTIIPLECHRCLKLPGF